MKPYFGALAGFNVATFAMRFLPKGMDTSSYLIADFNILIGCVILGYMVGAIASK